MPSAPPVQIPVGRFTWGPRLALALAALSALVGLTTGWVSALTWWSVALWSLIWLLVCLLSWPLALREALPPGQLLWDGEGWHFQSTQGAAALARVRVRWDQGESMLVEIQALPGQWPGRRWTWLRRRDMPGLWHGWRCAVHARDNL